MDPALGSPAPVAQVCDCIARVLRPAAGPVPQRLGSVTLLPHQSDAVARVRHAIEHLGGALLADPVGTGKTYVALAVAAPYRAVTIVAPATLRTMWQGALAATMLRATVLTFEALGRRGRALEPADAPPAGSRELLIVDEAHHARNPATRRFDALARLAWGRDVLLLTATPVHNRAADLHALCSLFLGDAARRLSPDALARLVCRRLDLVPHRLPVLAPLQWLPVPDDGNTLAALLQLPPPLAPRDAGCATALGTLGLLRQWCSSEAALAAALDRRLTTGVALEARLADGHLLSRAELRRWIVETGVLQLDFPFDAGGGSAPHGALRQVRAHLEAVRALRDRLRARPADAERWRLLHGILGDAPSTRAVLFTHSADTAAATYRALASHHRCAMLAGHATRIAHGAARRDDVIRQFAPTGSRAHTARAMHVDVLIATDLLSEGVDLHDAGLLVHLDLPWTVARLEQRAGRLRRLGATHDWLRHVAFEPPGGAGRVLRLMQRLARKAGLVRQHVGADLLAFALPGQPAGSGPAPPDAMPTDTEARLTSIARAWLDDAGASGASATPPRPLVCGVRRTRGTHCFVAAVEGGDGPRVVAGTDAGITSDPAIVAAACESCRASPGEPFPAAVPLPARVTRLVLRQLARWRSREGARRVLVEHRPGATHRRLLRRLATARLGTGRHARQDLAVTLEAVRDRVLRSVGAGAERFLHQWMEAHHQRALSAADLRQLLDTLEHRATPARATGAPAGALAVLILVPPPRDS